MDEIPNATHTVAEFWELWLDKDTFSTSWKLCYSPSCFAWYFGAAILVKIPLVKKHFLKKMMHSLTVFVRWVYPVARTHPPKFQISHLCVVLSPHPPCLNSVCFLCWQETSLTQRSPAEGRREGARPESPECLYRTLTDSMVSQWDSSTGQRGSPSLAYFPLTLFISTPTITIHYSGKKLNVKA